MYTAIPRPAKKGFRPTAFLLANGDISPVFQECCVCTSCSSKELTFHEYLDDAKCNACGQYQNEDIIELGVHVAFGKLTPAVTLN